MTSNTSRFILLSLLVVGLAESAMANAWSFLRRVEGDVIVVTDVTEAGRLQKTVSPENPVYFKGLSLGNKLGSIGGDREPDVKKLTALTTKLLRKQGYLGSPGPAKPPTLYLVISWGYMNGNNPREALAFLGYNPAYDPAAGNGSAMLGPEVFRRGMRPPDVQRVLEYSNIPLYGILITAFDYSTIAGDKPVIYWQTRIAFPATSTTMYDSLPRMLTVAATQIGKPTDRPLLEDMENAVKGEVILSDFEVLGFGEDAERPQK